MSVQHSAITEAQGIHEPKGVSTAASGEAYIADGSGSGAWYGVQKAQGACLKASTTGSTTGITTAYQELNSSKVGGSLTWTENNNVGSLTVDTTLGYIVAPETGVYNMMFNCSFISASTPSVFRFTFGKDSGSGIVAQESFVFAEIRTTGTTDTHQASFVCLPSITASDKVYVMVKETTGGDEFELVNCNFVMTRVG